MVFEKIVSLVSDKIDSDAGALSLETAFADLGMDSLEITEIVMTLEDEFDIEIEVDQSLKTIGDLVTLIESKI